MIRRLSRSNDYTLLEDQLMGGEVSNLKPGRKLLDADMSNVQEGRIKPRPERLALHQVELLCVTRVCFITPAAHWSCVWNTKW